MERSNNGDVTQGWKHPKIAVGMQEENHLPTVKRGSILKSSMASPKINRKPEKMCHSSSGNFTKFSELPIFLGLSTLGGDAGVVVPWRCLRTGWWWKTSGEISKLVKNHCWEELRFRFVPFFLSLGTSRGWKPHQKHRRFDRLTKSWSLVNQSGDIQPIAVLLVFKDPAKDFKVPMMKLSGGSKPFKYMYNTIYVCTYTHSIYSIQYRSKFASSSRGRRRLVYCAEIGLQILAAERPKLRILATSWITSHILLAEQNLTSSWWKFKL